MNSIWEKILIGVVVALIVAFLTGSYEAGSVVGVISAFFFG